MLTPVVVVVDDDDDDHDAALGSSRLPGTASTTSSSVFRETLVGRSPSPILIPPLRRQR
jgi:hypothetical protein